MADLSNASESAIVQHIIGEATWGVLAGQFLQLHDGAPGEDGTANVLASMGGRIDVSAGFAAESGGAASTDTAYEWTNGSGGNVTVSHISQWTTAGTGDPPTGGVCVMIGALTASKVVPDTEVFRLPSGSYTVQAS